MFGSANMTILVETIFYGGSIALFSENQFVGTVSQPPESSRSEELLSSINTLLNEYSITKNQINGLIVTLGSPGKTAERISCSIVKGISDALNIEIRYALQQNVLLRMFDSSGEFLIVDFINDEMIYWLECNISGDIFRKKDKKDLFREKISPNSKVYVKEGILPLLDNDVGRSNFDIFNSEDVFNAIIREASDSKIRV